MAPVIGPVSSSVKEFLRRVSSQKTMTMIGLLVVNLPNGFQIYYANLLSYSDSYMHVRLGADISWSTPVTLSTLMLFWAAGMALCQELGCKRLPNKLVMVVCCALIDLCLLSTYWAVQTSVLAVVILMGPGVGLVNSQVSAVIYNYALGWATPDDVGLVTVIATTLGLGPIFINYMVTFYLNPDNLLATTLGNGNLQYFSQAEILDRVPSVFVYLAFGSLAAHGLGILLLHEPPNRKAELHQSKDVVDTCSHGRLMNEESALLTPTNLGNSPQLGAHGKVMELPTISPQTDGSGNTNFDEPQNTTEISVFNTANNSCGDNRVLSSSQVSQNRLDSSSISIDLEEISRSKKRLWLKETLRRPEFYIVASLIAVFEYSFSLQAVYYKQFGAVYIHDDHFLSIVGTFISFTNLISRILWGVVLDRYKLKTVLTYVMASLVILSTFWLFTPMVNKWLYLLWNILICATITAMFAISPVAVYKYFGTENFVTINGLATTSMVLVIMPFPLITRCLLDFFSWFGLFTSVTVSVAASLFAALVFLPRDI